MCERESERERLPPPLAHIPQSTHERERIVSRLQHLFPSLSHNFLNPPPPNSNERERERENGGPKEESPFTNAAAAAASAVQASKHAGGHSEEEGGKGKSENLEIKADFPTQRVAGEEAEEEEEAVDQCLLGLSLTPTFLLYYNNMREGERQQEEEEEEEEEEEGLRASFVSFPLPFSFAMPFSSSSSSSSSFSSAVGCQTDLLSSSLPPSLQGCLQWRRRRIGGGGGTLFPNLPLGVEGTDLGGGGGIREEEDHCHIG